MATTKLCPYTTEPCCETECMAWNALPDEIYCLICQNTHKNKGDAIAKIPICIATNGELCPYRGCSALTEIAPMNKDWLKRAYVHRQNELAKNQKKEEVLTQ